jgi:signal transduction histidine kinase
MESDPHPSIRLVRVPAEHSGLTAQTESAPENRESAMLRSEAVDPLLVEAAVAERLERWQELAAQLSSVAAGHDDTDFLRVHLKISVELLGAAAGSIEVHPLSANSAVLSASVGFDARICNAVNAAFHDLDQANRGLGSSGVGMSQPRELTEFPRLQRTLLLSLLHRIGLRSVVNCALTDGAGRPFGASRFFFTDGRVPSKSARLMSEALAQGAARLLERRWLQQRSDAANEQVRALLDGALDAVVVTDQERLIVSANQAAYALFGFTGDELLGAPLAMILPDLPEFPRGVVREKLKTSIDPLLPLPPLHPSSASHFKSAVFEVEARRQDGAVVPLELSLSDTLETGNVIAIIRDITARRLQENIVRDSDRLAMIGTLSAGLGHDMNNVLLPVRAHLNALDALGAQMNAADRREHVQEIRSCVGYLQKLADSLHLLAMDPKAEADSGACTDLALWWAQTGPLLSKSLEPSCELVVDFPAGLSVAIAPHSLTSAMLNILVNAREAMPSERSVRNARVVVSAGRANVGGFTDVEIKDNGSGMSEEVLRRASEMFFTTKPRGLGTGLGLALVRGVVERAGGRMELESREGVGTTVRLRLPSVNLAIDAGTTRACVRGLSGRTTALLESLLSTHGIGLDRDGDLKVAEYWICAAAAFEKHELIHWLLTRPATRVVIVGKLPLRLAREVASMGASLVTDTVDLLALQRAVDRAAAT